MRCYRSAAKPASLRGATTLISAAARPSFGRKRSATSRTCTQTNVNLSERQARMTTVKQYRQRRASHSGHGGLISADVDSTTAAKSSCRNIRPRLSATSSICSRASLSYRANQKEEVQQVPATSSSTTAATSSAAATKRIGTISLSAKLGSPKIVSVPKLPSLCAATRKGPERGSGVILSAASTALTTCN